jgi:Protein of unknown function (DUF3592)
MRTQNFSFLFFGLFAAIGLLAGVLSIQGFYNTYLLKQRGLSTQGKVVELRFRSRKSSAPVVEFMGQNGVKHTFASNLYTNLVHFKVGEQIDLIYDPQNPKRVSIKKLNLLGHTMPLVFFLAFGGAGFGGIFYLYKQKKKKNWLHLHGKKVQARIIKTEKYKYNDSSVRLVCQWRDPMNKREYLFYSPWLSLKTQGVRKTWQNGQVLEVYFDPNRPQHYVIELVD